MLIKAFGRGVILIAFLLITSFAALAQDTKITVVSWNVESGGANPATVAQRIRTFQGMDLWGLSEVTNDSDASTFETASEDGDNADFERITGQS